MRRRFPLGKPYSSLARPAENKPNLARAERNERRGETGRDVAERKRTRTDLYAEAKRQDIPGRSRMSQAQLERVLGK
jgi:hypothetical protein